MHQLCAQFKSNLSFFVIKRFAIFGKDNENHNFDPTQDVFSEMHYIDVKYADWHMLWFVFRLKDVSCIHFSIITTKTVSLLGNINGIKQMNMNVSQETLVYITKS